VCGLKLRVRILSLAPGARGLKFAPGLDTLLLTNPAESFVVSFLIGSGLDDGSLVAAVVDGAAFSLDAADSGFESHRGVSLESSALFDDAVDVGSKVSADFEGD